MRRYMESVIHALLAVDSKNEYVIYYDHPSHLGKNPGATEKVINLPTAFLADHIGVPLATRRDNIDVLFCTKNVVPPLVACKSVVTFHDLGYLVDSGFYPAKDTAYMKLAMRWSARKSDAIITISENTKVDVMSRLGANAEKITCVYHAADESYRRIEDKEQLDNVRVKYNLPPEFILCVSALQPRKNLPNLIEAFSLLRRNSEVSHKLVIVGASSWGSSTILTQMEASPVAREMVWIEYVAEEDLPAIYNLASLLVFPSWYEGFGLPVLEAMACGCPVVCSNTSSMPEVAGDAALLIDPTSIEQIADGIHRVLVDEPLKDSLIEKGLKRASGFSWERAAAETLGVIEAVYHGR